MNIIKIIDGCTVVITNDPADKVYGSITVKKGDRIIWQTNIEMEHLPEDSLQA